MMLKLKIEQGLLMEGTKKIKENFLKKNLSFGPFPNGIKALKQVNLQLTQILEDVSPKAKLEFALLSSWWRV